jgi:anthranilate 1,2-dioxygenase large subunit
MHVHWPHKYSQIPKEVFQREDVFQEELKRIFYGPEWHPVAHLAEIPQPGDFKTFIVGKAPIIIVHGDDGVPRVFLNACPHRGNQVETCARGSARKLECPYHRWTFGMDGSLLGAPGMSDFPADFRKTDFGLTELPSTILKGLIFTTFSADAPPIDTYLGEAKSYLDRILGDGRLRLLGYQKVFFDTNWKEYGDNDHYHPPLLHQAFRLLKWQGANGSSWMTEYGHLTNEVYLTIPNASFLNDPSLVEVRGGEPVRSIIVALFPLNAAFRHLNTINIRFAIPHSPHKTEVHYAYFAQQSDDDELAKHRLRQGANLLGPSGFITLEDGAVFNRLHRGSGTPGNVEFQKGVTGPLTAPVPVNSHDEAVNLVKWDRYRRIMEFDRADA